jgi:hypothetical protein
MRLLSAIGISVLALAIVVPAYAQDKPDQKEEEKDKPAKENEKKEQAAKPAKQQEEKNAKPAEKNNRQEEKSAQQPEKNNRQEEKSAQQPEKNNQQEQRNTQQQTRSNQPERRNAQQGGRIPAERYQANFGREHTFRVSQGDFRSGRFQYGGYSFGFGGAWPSNWLYTQDVYVIEIDGMYYLCNPMYPGVNLAINVTL